MLEGNLTATSLLKMKILIAYKKSRDGFLKLELLTWKGFENSIQNCKISIKETNRGRGVHQGWPKEWS